MRLLPLLASDPPSAAPTPWKTRRRPKIVELSHRGLFGRLLRVHSGFNWK